MSEVVWTDSFGHITIVDLGSFGVDSEKSFDLSWTAADGDSSKLCCNLTRSGATALVEALIEEFSLDF